jgi:hypothetical protein
MDGGAVIAVLAASSLAVLSLRNCCQVIYHLHVSSMQGAIQLLSFQKLEEIPPGVRHVLGD